MEKIPVKTIKKIEEDIEKNDLGKARERLHGLISTYPNELELRRMLGDIYFKLKYPSMAGRYWYLEKHKTSQMVQACILFEKSMGNDAFRISRALKFKGDRDILIRLELDQVISPIHNKVKENLMKQPDDELKDKLVIFGCFSIIILTFLFALLGVYSLLNWIF
ncbi:DNA helicase (plasmid) [Peribacillus muralis]|uniref:DNA helicase n=1 Tax=Peribacillus muralis TaxID=264697 RepID=A0A1B3XW80_9BACI|nr:DUF6584 family protein [Peribacillus muralis]AOH57462.1 DNA helicase [Peribacillus muralis]